MTKDDLYMPHVNVDDCYYSCPASGECCDEQYRGRKECNCWAKTQNANVDAVWRELETLRGIVNDLAAQPDPMTIRLSGHCWHCDRTGKHAESCPYGRSIEYVNSSNHKEPK